MHLPSPANHHIPSGRPAPADIALQAAASGATPDEQVWRVAVALTDELREHHHTYIPTATVRAACLYLLYGKHAEGSWHDRAAATYVTVEQQLLDGALYEQADMEGIATTTMRVGRVISQTAATRLATTPDQPVWEAIEQARVEMICRARDWITANTGLDAGVSDAFDHLNDATADGLLQHLTAIPAENISAITPSQILADARAAGARPAHVLDAVAVGIASVMAPVTRIDFNELLTAIDADVRETADGWVTETLGIDATRHGFTYDEIGSGNVSRMLDHVGQLARQYDVYTDDPSAPELPRRVRPRDQ